jgi:antirestriction protein ArdC
MPPFEAFKEPLFYYSVLSHEATHWTGAKCRLDRDLSGRFGSESYAAEELIAELGAAMLCAELGLPTDPREDHAPYVASWLKVLKNDKRAIFTAAAKAQAATDWMMKRTAPELEEAA